MGEIMIGVEEQAEALVDTIGQMMTGTPLDQIQKEGVAA